MRGILLFLTATTMTAAAYSLTTSSAQEYEALYHDIPFDMESVMLPSIPNTTLSVSDMGGRGDGVSLSTDAFAKGIDSLAAVGGGTLLVPQGVWLTGPITLRSHIRLHLETGAVILFSDDEQLYPLTETIFEGEKTKRRLSPITADNAHDIAITGRGVIDGNGKRWRPLKKIKTTSSQWNDITSGEGDVSANGQLWQPAGDRAATRPTLVKITNCRRILLKDVTLRNSPAWNVHPLMSSDITIDGVTILNPSYAQNGDGIDLESCRNVIITGSTLSVGDDAICLKSGKNEEGRLRAAPTENVIVNGCTVYSTHGGFVIGSEMSGGVRNVSVADCQFIGSDNGLRFKSARGRGGVVEKIFVKNISMADISHCAVVFDLYYDDSAPEEKHAVDEGTPLFRDITIENVACHGCEQALLLRGLPEMPLKNISLRNISALAHKQSSLLYCEDLRQENVNVVLSPATR